MSMKTTQHRGGAAAARCTARRGFERGDGITPPRRANENRRSGDRHRAGPRKNVTEALGRRLQATKDRSARAGRPRRSSPAGRPAKLREMLGALELSRARGARPRSADPQQQPVRKTRSRDAPREDRRESGRGSSPNLGVPGRPGVDGDSVPRDCRLHLRRDERQPQSPMGHLRAVSARYRVGPARSRLPRASPSRARAPARPVVSHSSTSVTGFPARE